MARASTIRAALVRHPGEAVVAGEIVRVSRYPMAVEVGRRGTGHPMVLGKLARSEAVAEMLREMWAKLTGHAEIPADAKYA